MKDKIYIPENSYCPITLGERHFFKSKVWKLLVIFGEDWTTLGWTLRGFTLWNYGGKKHFEYITSKLDELGISYKCDQSSWQTRINISTRKANLQKIDELYEDWKVLCMNTIQTSGIQYYYKNHFAYSESAMKKHIEAVISTYPCIADEFIPIPKLSAK